MPSRIGDGTTAANEDERDDESAASDVGGGDDDGFQQSAVMEEENSIPDDDGDENDAASSAAGGGTDVDDGDDGSEDHNDAGIEQRALDEARKIMPPSDDETSLQDDVDNHFDGLQNQEEEASSDSENEPTSAAEEEGEDASRSSHSSFDSPVKEQIMLGGPNGSNGTPAYALLAGMIVDDDDDTTSLKKDEIISIPITCLPTTLGREHETKDPSFIGLKDGISGNDADVASNAENSAAHAHKMSQSMCCIFYRDAHGGKLGQYKKGRKKENPESVVVDEKGKKSVVMADPLDGMIYKPYEASTTGGDDHDKCTPDEILRLPGMDANAPLPTTGFFAIECTGRKIIVDGMTLKKGQSAMLRDGIPIKIATHCLYFLLPNSSSLSASKPLPSIKVKVTTPIKPEKVVSLSSNSVKLEKVESQKSISKDNENPSSSSPQTQQQPPPAKKPRKSEEIIASIDDKTDVQLLTRLSQKIKDESPWDHECQRLGTALATRACRAAAHSTHVQQIVKEEGGVTQREILDWMSSATSDFKDYESMMLSRIERKSFMMSINKGILRAGFTKNEYLSGRAFRWNLPKDIAKALGWGESGNGEDQQKKSPGGVDHGGSKNLMDTSNDNDQPNKEKSGGAGLIPIKTTSADGVKAEE